MLKLKVEKNLLLNATQNTIAAIPSRSTLPILTHFLIETTKEFLKITATDLEICIRKKIAVLTAEEGKLSIPAKKFQEIIREIPDEVIEIEEVKNNSIVIKGKNCQFRLLGFSPSEYPEIPIIKGKELTFSAEILKDLIEKTYFAVSKEETRYVLNGILLELDNNYIRLVASDGKRLALAEKKITNIVEGNYIIPQKAFVELIRLLDGKADVKLTISEKGNQIAFELEDSELITRLIEGNFPNYQEVIPEGSSNKLVIDRSLFLSALRRASIFTTIDSLATTLEIRKDKMIVSKITPELGEAREEIDIEYEGEEMVINFNPNYLIDALKIIAQDKICFELNGTDKPGVIRIDKEYIYLVLPMQTL